MSFARQLRAHFADLGAIGLLSATLTFAATGVVFTVLFTTPEDFWLRPAMMSVRLPAFLLLVIVVFTELVRCMRWTDRRDVFVAMHFVTTAATFCVLGFLILTHDSLVQQRATDRATDAQKRAVERLREWQVKSAEEARAAEAARKAEQECLGARKAAVDIASRRKSVAIGALRRCRDEFEQSKTIFTTATSDEHCRAWRRELAVAGEDVKTATALACAPAMTGTVEPRPGPSP